MQTYEHKVQYYETDQMGIAHHSNYIRWFEEARTYFLEVHGFGYDKMEESGVLSPVLGIHAEYKTMTRFADVVQIETVLSEYNGIRMTVSYVVRDKKTQEVRCTGESKHCFLNKDGKPLSLKRSYPAIHQILLDTMEKEK